MKQKGLVILKRKKQSEQGITLVVLIITIVILIILSAVTISTVFGDGGLIEQAKKTKDDATNMITGNNGDMNKLLQEYSNMMATDSGIENPDINDIENPNQNEIEDPGTEEPILPEGWDGEKVDAIESEDGVIVPIPKGYVASSATGENRVSGGFVIYEGEEKVTDSNVQEVKTSRNQFVWIPVANISDIANLTSGYDTAGRLNYQGKLYNFSSTGATEMSSYGQGTESYREPDILADSNYDNNTSNMNIVGVTSGNAFRQQLQLEFNEMIESVDTYGGFYIGRYETGNLSSSIGAKPVVVKGNNSISNVNWYYMYRNSKEITANNNVKSTMIWGCLWDRTLIWLTETNTASSGINGKSYAEIVNSSGWGNYNVVSGGTGNKQATGNDEAWKANNIYDMAGNVYDWTIEAIYSDDRALRGGIYDGSGLTHPASSRLATFDNSTPHRTDMRNGCRSALYIVP